MCPCCPVLANKMLRKLSQNFHILRIAAWDVWLQDLEDAAFPPPRSRILPSEGDYGANTRFGKDNGRNFDPVGANLRPQFLRNDGADLFRRDVRDTVFEF